MIHEDAIDLIQYFEGCYNVAYACPSHVSRGGEWPYLTIGYGHSGPDVHQGMKITTSQAQTMLARDLANVEHMVSKMVTIPLASHQMGAVCALAMNLKPGLFQKSKTLRLLNSGDFGSFSYPDVFQNPLGPRLTGMAREWAEFRMAKGVGILNGLVKRRACELQLFFNGVWHPPQEDQMPQGLLDPSSRNNQVFKPGHRSPQIADLHEALAVAGFPIEFETAYTWVTAEAVMDFQKQHGLKVDGIYGQETSSKLAEVIDGVQP